MKAAAMKSELRFILSFLLVAALFTTAMQGIAAEPEPSEIRAASGKGRMRGKAVTLDESTK